MSIELIRCGWTGGRELDTIYHDSEWGVPVHDDRKHFEFIILDGFQAGLSWATILKKRENFREAFDNFVPEIIAGYNQEKLDELMNNTGIIRNKLKIASSVTNARSFLKLQKEFQTFDKYIWQFTQGKTIVNNWKTMRDIPARTPESDAMSKDLLKNGFKFVGSTICYAYMQAAGMVNDHLIECFRYKEVTK
ncbi:MAG: DNA-3-methyladenine glycosylase I [Ignavibacteriae bacterium]|nr:DNA-3-methyladenine glycosylase I [Ignavibacteriota bacterium]